MSGAVLATRHAGAARKRFEAIFSCLFEPTLDASDVLVALLTAPTPSVQCRSLQTIPAVH